MVAESHLFVDQFLVPGEADVQIVVLIEPSVCEALETVADEFVIDFAGVHDGLEVVEIPELAGLVDAVGALVEALGVIEFEAVHSRLEEVYEQQQGDYGRARPAFPVVAVHRHHASRVLCIIKHILLR